MGAATGLFLMPVVSDRFGRKKAYLFNCIAYFIGVALSCGAQNVTMMCFGRAFTGFGGWANMLAAISYGSEISTPKRRGILGGGYGCAITLGYVFAGWTTVGIYFAKSTFAWRAPFLIQLLFPALIVSGLPFVPESPRKYTTDMTIRDSDSTADHVACGF
jgi:MFS family permease